MEGGETETIRQPGRASTVETQTEAGRLAPFEAGWRPHVCVQSVDGERQGRGSWGNGDARNGSKSRAGGAIAKRICQVRTYTDARALLLGARVTPAWFGGFVIAEHVVRRRRPLHRRRMRARSRATRDMRSMG